MYKDSLFKINPAFKPLVWFNLNVQFRFHWKNWLLSSGLVLYHALMYYYSEHHWFRIIGDYSVQYILPFFSYVYRNGKQFFGCEPFTYAWTFHKWILLGRNVCALLHGPTPVQVHLHFVGSHSFNAFECFEDRIQLTER